MNSSEVDLLPRYFLLTIQNKANRHVSNALGLIVDPTADLISALKLRVLGELWFFAEAG